MSLELITMATAARITADQHPTRLERIRQRREAPPVTLPRLVPRRRFGARLTGAAAWLRPLRVGSAQNVTPASGASA
jgi:hypothetical protein